MMSKRDSDCTRATFEGVWVILAKVGNLANVARADKDVSCGEIPVNDEVRLQVHHSVDHIQQHGDLAGKARALPLFRHDFEKPLHAAVLAKGDHGDERGTAGDDPDERHKIRVAADLGHDGGLPKKVISCRAQVCASALGTAVVGVVQHEFGGHEIPCIAIELENDKTEGRAGFSVEGASMKLFGGHHGVTGMHALASYWRCREQHGANTKQELVLRNIGVVMVIKEPFPDFSKVAMADAVD